MTACTQSCPDRQQYPGRALWVPLFLALFTHFVTAAKANDTSSASGARESTLGGMCFQNTLPDMSALQTIRRQVVKFNQQKSIYRDGDIIATYKLDRPGHGSLAGCADACLLNWRLTSDTTQALDTDCSLNENSHCPMTSGILVADRKCEAFMFNRITSVCTLLSGEQSLKLTQSSNHWSGKLVCEDMSSVDDWAQGVVSRRSPPPPPPPSPPPPPPSPPPPTPPSIITSSILGDVFTARFSPGVSITGYFGKCVPSGSACTATGVQSPDVGPSATSVTTTGLTPGQTYSCYLVYVLPDTTEQCISALTDSACTPTYADPISQSAICTCGSSPTCFCDGDITTSQVFPSTPGVCGTMVSSSGIGSQTIEYTVVPGGTYRLRFDAYGIPDRFVVRYESICGPVEIDTGFRGQTSSGCLASSPCCSPSLGPSCTGTDGAVCPDGIGTGVTQDFTIPASINTTVYVTGFGVCGGTAYEFVLEGGGGASCPV